MSKSKLYKVWCRIKGCTTSPTHADYKFYGEKGVSVCKEWRDSFETFRDWAFENGYEEGLTIDRIDPDGDYSPRNCRWVSILEQQHNRSNNIQITLNGETKCLSEWAKLYGINRYTVRSRHEKGMPWHDALTAPVGR